MLRSGLRRAAAASAPLRTLRRNLNLHEYQSAALMAEKGVNVPFGLPATTVEEAVAAAATIGDEEVVIKSQILAGGRGLGSCELAGVSVGSRGVCGRCACGAVQARAQSARAWVGAVARVDAATPSSGAQRSSSAF